MTGIDERSKFSCKACFGYSFQSVKQADEKPF